MDACQKVLMVSHLFQDNQLERPRLNTATSRLKDDVKVWAHFMVVPIRWTAHFGLENAHLSGLGRSEVWGDVDTTLNQLVPEMRWYRCTYKEPCLRMPHYLPATWN